MRNGIAQPGRMALVPNNRVLLFAIQAMTLYVKRDSASAAGRTAATSGLPKPGAVLVSFAGSAGRIWASGKGPEPAKIQINGAIPQKVKTFLRP
jgi:hypothetical protein